MSSMKMKIVVVSIAICIHAMITLVKNQYILDALTENVFIADLNHVMMFLTNQCNIRTLVLIMLLRMVKSV